MGTVDQPILKAPPEAEVLAWYGRFMTSSGVCTDTRALLDGGIFVALSGANFNGNRFAAEALAKGCAFAIVDEAEAVKDERYWLVPDALAALQALARHHRRILNIPLVGITGSNGKTTTKELVSRVLAKQYRTAATKGNLNNHIGVPLTLLSLSEKDELAVVEMGANHQGEIRELSAICEPNYALITNIGKAHLEGFGGEEGVIAGKSELYKHMRKNGGLLVVNENDDLLMRLSKGYERITYGVAGHSDVWAEVVSDQPTLTFDLVLKRSGERARIASHLSGNYNLDNMLAALCLGAYFRVPLGEMAEAIENYVPTNNRSQVEIRGNKTLYLDAYNANPSSMGLALRNFARLSAGKPSALVLGGMNELGEASENEHRALLDLVAELGFMKGKVVGPHFNGLLLPKGFDQVQDVSELEPWWPTLSDPDTLVLIKGSRSNRLEQVLEQLSKPLF